MAKFLGALVGTKIAANIATFINNFLKDGRDDLLIRDNVLLTTAVVINDTISLGSFKSTALLSPTPTIWNDILGASVALDVGDVTYPQGLGAALAVATAGSQTLWKNFTPAKMGMPLWQALGYAADPGGVLELLATVKAANVTTQGRLAWQIFGINR